MAKKQEQKPPCLVPDPYDMTAKRQLHAKADRKNFIGVRQGRSVLFCGANPKKAGKLEKCKSLAGMGTGHPGFGRCKFCGGANTGPKTAAGKAKVSQNARKHGLYSSVLSDEEHAIFQTLRDTGKIDLMDDIFVLKAKIIAYLGNVRRNGEVVDDTSVSLQSGSSLGKVSAGSISDDVFLRALNELGRLVRIQGTLDSGVAENLVSQINIELRAASQQTSAASWGGQAQHFQT